MISLFLILLLFLSFRRRHNQLCRVNYFRQADVERTNTEENERTMSTFCDFRSSPVPPRVLGGMIRSTRTQQFQRNHKIPRIIGRIRTRKIRTVFRLGLASFAIIKRGGCSIIGVGVAADDGQPSSFSSSFSSHQLRAAAGTHHQQQRQNNRQTQTKQTTKENSKEDAQQEQPESSSSSVISPSSGTPHMSSGTTNESISSRPIENSDKRQHEDQKARDERFLEWCRDSLGISTDLIEIDYFPYNDYLQAMEDRVDIFCEDCQNVQDISTDFNDSDDKKFTGDFNLHSRRPTPMTDDYYNQYDEDVKISVTDYPMISVRGLKAAQDIHAGQVLIQIPHASLWTLTNVVDTDPVLAPVMGLQARKEYGWDTPVDEIPLLSVALLYHFQLGSTSPHWPYLQQLLGQNRRRTSFDDNHNVDGTFSTVSTVKEAMLSLQKSIPHLWSPKKLRKSATSGVRSVSKGIQRDVLELYETIVLVLIEDHPTLFGAKPGGYDDRYGKRELFMKENDDGTEKLETDPDTVTGIYQQADSKKASKNHTEVDWMFSLETFHWAFALVNSRHWHLPIPSDLLAVNRVQNESTGSRDENFPAKHFESDEYIQEDEDDHVSFSDQEGPPAATPTDEWLDYQRELQRKEEEARMQNQKQNDGGSEGTVFESRSFPADAWTEGDSFLAPVADLINFGPPCTRGLYNNNTDAFEIVATCDFVKGQEITFFYTDACEDVFVANYGFTEPSLVPKCTDPTTERIQQLEGMLYNAWKELDMYDSEVNHLLDVLRDCHCENQTNLLGGRNGIGEPPKPPSSPSPQQKRASPSAQQRRPKNGDRSHSDINGLNSAKHAIRGRNRRGSTSSKKKKVKPQRDVLERGNDTVDNDNGYTRKSEF